MKRLSKLLCWMFGHKWKLVGIPNYDVLPMQVISYGITCTRCDKFRMCMVGEDE